MSTPENQPTVVGVAPDADTMYAYSVAQPPWPGEYVDYPEDHRSLFGSAALRAAGVVLAVTVGGAAALLLAFNHQTQRAAQPPTAQTMTVTITSPSTVTTSATVTVTTSETATVPAETRDRQYLRLFSQLTGFGVGDPTAVIALGHQQCDFLSQPATTPADAAADIIAKYSAPGSGKELTRQQAYGVVEAAVTVYCPEYKHLL